MNTVTVMSTKTFLSIATDEQLQLTIDACIKFNNYFELFCECLSEKLDRNEIDNQIELKFDA